MGQAADRLGRVGKKLRLLPDEAIKTGNSRIRSRAMAALREDAGPDRKLSGLTNGRAQTVKTTKRTSGPVVSGRIMAGPASQRAPWFWLEEGTARGLRGPKVGRYNSSRAFRGGHPGTKAKRTWSRSVGPALPEVRAEIEALYRKALKG